MAFSVDVDIKRQFEVACPFDRVFEVLTDVPQSASHFPNVDELVDLGNESFRWEMKKIGVDRYAIQTIYACKYTNDRDKGWIKWTPIKKEGNAIVRGKWTLKDLGEDVTRIKLTTKGELEVPLPRLVKMLVGPVVVREFSKMIDKYIVNLTKTFETKKPARRKKNK